MERKIEVYATLKPKEKKRAIEDLKIEMELLADALEFEKAAQIRDFINSTTKK